MIRVLVLMASFNGEKFIKEQIKSILKQKKVIVDILISDDNSEDNTRNIINEFTRSHPNIKLIKNTSTIRGSARNFYNLIHKSNLNNVSYIAFSDQDDIWNENKLYDAINKMTANFAEGYSAPVIAFWHDGEKKLIEQSSRITSKDYLFEGAGQGCTFVMSYNLFSNIKIFYNEHSDIVNTFFFHDWFVYLFARSSGVGWYFDNLPYVYYRQHGKNIIGARNNFYAIKKRVCLIKNGWYKSQVEKATKLSWIINSENSKDFEIIYNHNSFYKKVEYALYVLFKGRRKIQDRLILVIMILFGYL